MSLLTDSSTDGHMWPEDGPDWLKAWKPSGGRGCCHWTSGKPVKVEVLSGEWLLLWVEPG